MVGIDKNYLLSDLYVDEMLKYYDGNYTNFINFLYVSFCFLVYKNQGKRGCDYLS